MKVITIIGARPQFVKAAMLSAKLQEEGITEIIVHTGQHYDENMSGIFFEQMGIPRPKYHLQVGSGTHSTQTAKMMTELETVVQKEKPDGCVVYGDTNSTLAGALVAAKEHVPVIHVEAGMRSYDKLQPEEINRVATDHVSSLHLCSSISSQENLNKEGITDEVHIVGDLMYDSTVEFSKQESIILEQLNIKANEYYVMTCHRPETTNTKEHLAGVIKAVCSLDTAVVFAMHPRTKNYLEQHGLMEQVKQSNVIIIEPVGYVDMLHLIKHSIKVITDSGGMQKEAYFLGKECITTREYTEWTELVKTGWNTITGYDAQKILQAIHKDTPTSPRPEIFGPPTSSSASAKVIKRFLRCVE